MGMFGILDISAAGMDVQQARLEAAAMNLANSRTTAAQGAEGYKPLAVVIHSVNATGVTASFADPGATMESLPRPMVTATVQTDAAPRLVYDPGHPDANEQGFVSLPGVDPIASMLDLISISRGYEANLHAFDITRALLQQTLDIGSRR
jgi:flagellar basal-body rod protein FlgC